MKTYEVIKIYEVAMDNLSQLEKKFIYTVEMEKDINDEKIEARLHSFRKEISDAVKIATQDVLELFNFEPVLDEFPSDIKSADRTDEDIIEKLDECLLLLRKDHDYYMFQHQISVFIVRYGNKGVDPKKDFFDILKHDMSGLKKHFSKRNIKIDKSYIEECVRKIVSVIKPLIKKISQKLEYEECLKERERVVEKLRQEHFYNPLPLEKLRVIKNFISREDFEKCLIEHNFNPCLSSFSDKIQIRHENIITEIREKKAKEYYDLV